MVDIYHEVQEDIRRDRLKAAWARYGVVVVVAAVLIVAGVGGWRAYEHFEAQAAAAAGDRFQAAAKLAEDGKSDEARAAFATIAAEGPEGYRALARLREAGEVVAKDPAAALRLYALVADDAAADALLRDAARIRGGYVAVDHAARDEVRRLVDPLSTDASPWRHAAREALGLAAYKAGDAADARRQFEAIVSDADTPPGARQRADLMLAVLPTAAPKPAPAVQ